MAERKVKLKVEAEADTGELEDMEKTLSSLKQKVNDLNKQKIESKLELDSSKLDETNNKIKELKTYLDKVKADVDVNVDDSEIKRAEQELKQLEAQKADLELKVADDELKLAKKEIDSIQGEKIDVDVNVNDTEIKNAKKEIDDLQGSVTESLGSTSNAITGAIAGIAGKSIWDTIYGTSKRAETNKILLKNMSDSTVAYEDFYNKVDKTTDSSLISMQSLIPALNGIKAATGSNAETINNVTPLVAEFGQYVLALTGSEAKAETAMFDLSKGIKGLYASLDQYGITEDALMRTGLWSGKEDDVEGYMAAINAVTGDTSELMDTTQGLEALMGKAFSRGGKRLGEYVLPVMKSILTGFMGMDDAAGGWLSTTLLAAGGVASGLASMLSVVGQAGNGIKMIKDAYTLLIPVEWAEGTAGWFSVGWIAVAIALGIALGLALIYLWNNSEQFRNAVLWLGESLQWLVNTGFSFLLRFLNYIQSIGQQVLASVGVTGNNIVNSILGFLVFFATLPIQIQLYFLDMIGRTLGFRDNFSRTLINTARNTVTSFINAIAQMPVALIQEFNEMLNAALNFAGRLPQIIWDTAVNAVWSWVGGTGEHSPGFMYDAFEGELKAMDSISSQYARSIPSKLFSMGDDMVSGFDISSITNSNGGLLNSRLDMVLSGNSTDNTGFTGVRDVIFNGCMFDKKERVQEVLDILRDYLSWNNTTAGRTV